MKRAILFAVFAVACTTASAQSVPTFCTSFGSGEFDKGLCGTKTYDGGYAVAGISYFGSFQNNYIVKCDAAGNVVWQHDVGSDFTDDFYGITETANHDLVAVGLMNGKAVAARYDANGALVWSKEISVQALCSATGVTETSDGYLLITGESRNALGGNEQCEVIKLNSSGNLVWVKSFYNFGDSGDIGYAGVETADHRYVIGGLAASIENFFFLLALDTAGNELWTKLSSNSGVVYDLVATPDSGVALAGYVCPVTDCNALVAKFDKDGNMEWSQTYGDSLSDRFFGIALTPDGGYALAGTATDQLSLHHGYVMKCDEDGQMLWSVLTDDVELKSIDISPDGGLFTAGTAADLGQNLSLRKMDANGVTCPGCASGTYGVQGDGTTFTNAPLSLSNNPPTVSDVTMIESTFTPFQSFACSEVGIETSERSISIYPNPASTYFHVDAGHMQIIESEITIYDVNGKSCSTQPILTENTNVNVSQLPNGVYTVRITTSKESLVAKIIVMH